jgi:hypothetical protein
MKAPEWMRSGGLGENADIVSPVGNVRVTRFPEKVRLGARLA